MSSTSNFYWKTALCNEPVIRDRDAKGGVGPRRTRTVIHGETPDFLSTISPLKMKSDDPESDKIVSISQIQPLVSRKLPRVITPITGKKWQNESDAVNGVARATITHSESGTKDRRKPRKLVSELALEVKRGKGKARRRKPTNGPSVDTSRARASCDVVRLAIRELGWREVC